MNWGGYVRRGGYVGWPAMIQQQKGVCPKCWTCLVLNPHFVAHCTARIKFFQDSRSSEAFFELCSKENGKGNHPKQTYTGKQVHLNSCISYKLMETIWRFLQGVLVSSFAWKNASFRKVAKKHVFHVPSNVKCNETPPKGIPWLAADWQGVPLRWEFRVVKTCRIIPGLVSSYFVTIVDMSSRPGVVKHPFKMALKIGVWS